MPNFLKTPGTGIKNAIGGRGPGLTSAPSLARKMSPKLAKVPKGSSKKFSGSTGGVDSTDPSQVVRSPTYINTQLFSGGGSVPGPAPRKQLKNSSGGSKVISTKNF